MAKDQEEFNKEWESVSVILNENESVPTGFTDYCRDLVLYAHSIDDIKDDDIDKIKKEDYNRIAPLGFFLDLHIYQYH
jgi:hypothetical protein